MLAMEEYTTKEGWHTLPDTHSVYTKAWLVGVSCNAYESKETFSLIRFFLIVAWGPTEGHFAFCPRFLGSHQQLSNVFPDSRLSWYRNPCIRPAGMGSLRPRTSRTRPHRANSQSARRHHLGTQRADTNRNREGYSLVPYGPFDGRS